MVQLDFMSSLSRNAHQPHQKGDLKPYEDSNYHHKRIHQKLESLRIREREEQQGRGTAANPVRQLATPRPYFAPTMKPPFSIDGTTATHSARLKISSGMPESGAD